MDKVDTRVIIEPPRSGKWCAVPYRMSDGTRDWRVCYFDADSRIMFALNHPTRRKAEALADRLNRVVAWNEIVDKVI